MRAGKLSGRPGDLNAPGIRDDGTGMFPLSALLAHAELKTRARAAEADPASADARGATRVTRYGNVTLFPRVERPTAADRSSPYAPGESMTDDAIEATWEAPRVVASLSNVSTTGLGLIVNEELPTGLQFDLHWEADAEADAGAGPRRFEVVHTKPLQAGMYRTGARLLEGELPAEPVPTPFVRRFEMATDAAEPATPPPMTLAPAAADSDVRPAPQGPRPMSLVRDGVMALSRVPSDAPAETGPTPAGTLRMSAAAGFEKTERLDGVTTCGWERSIEVRRDGDRMWVYIHSPGKRNGWGIFVDPDAFEAAVGRVQATAGSPFIATTMAA